MSERRPRTPVRRTASRPSASRRIRVGLVVVAAVIVFATLWYWLAEGFGFVDALYQSVINVTTVGLREVHRLDTSGQIATILVVVVGVAAALHTLTALFEETVARELDHFGRRRMERRLDQAREHVVVCGYGRVGAKTATLLAEGGDTVVVVEQDPERATQAIEAGFLVVHGDATTDACLETSGLARARILVSALPTDADNLYVVLTGRDLNPRLHIVARAQEAQSEAKLVRAGADRVVNPEDIGARRLASVAVRPNVSEFLDVVTGSGSLEFRVEEISIPVGSRLDGSTIEASALPARTGALVLGLRAPTATLVANPPASTVLRAGDTVIVIGTEEQLRAAEHVVRSFGDA